MTQLFALPPERRRVVLVVTEAQMHGARRDMELDDLLDHPEVALIAVPNELSFDDSDPIAARLRRENLMRPGNLLVQSPYDPDVYKLAEAAVTEFAVRKFVLVSQLCALLGAKSVDTEHVQAYRRRATRGGEANARGGPGSAKVAVDSELLQTVEARLQMVDKFKGRPANLVQAQTLLDGHGLSGDSVLSSLIALRAGDNPITSRKISVSLVDSSHSNLRVAVDIAAMKVAKVSAGFRRQVEEEVEVTAQISVNF